MQTLSFPTIWDLPKRSTRNILESEVENRSTERFLTIWDNPRPSRAKAVSSQRTSTEQSELIS